MRKALLAAALMAVAAPAAQAFPIQTDTFVHEKSGYVVHSRTINGVMHLRGEHPVTGDTFRLKVSSLGRTTGTFAGKPVSAVVRAGKGGPQVAGTQDAYLIAGAK